jgi:CBS domain-containing protein
MNVKVADVMAPRVLVAMPTDKVSYIREVMRGQGIHAVPVIDEESRPAGIVTSTDLMDEPRGDLEVADIMTMDVITVPQNDPVEVAASVMRNNRVHHLVVTHEGEIAGILSSFDLLKVIEEYGFEVGNSPPETP